MKYAALWAGIELTPIILSIFSHFSLLNWYLKLIPGINCFIFRYYSTQKSNKRYSRSTELYLINDLDIFGFCIQYEIDFTQRSWVQCTSAHSAMDGDRTHNLWIWQHRQHWVKSNALLDRPWSHPLKWMVQGRHISLFQSVPSNDCRGGATMITLALAYIIWDRFYSEELSTMYFS